MKLRNLLFFIVTLPALLIALNANAGNNEPWRKIDNSRVAYVGERYIQPNKFLSFSLDRSLLQLQFQAAPEFTSVNSRQALVVVSIPMPDGSFQDFSVFRKE